MKRSELPDEVFGIPEERKYPMPDKRHTLSAIKLFGHVEPKYEEELAKNIIKNMKKYNIPESAVGKDNKLRKYIDKYYNESVELIEEKYIMNDDDIYYNKDKFDSGEINLCFITGHGGSGKSTMGEYMAKDKSINHIDLDDVIYRWQYTCKELFKSQPIIESFFTKGPGLKYYYTNINEILDKFPDYHKDITMEFIDYIIDYAKANSNERNVVEGVWLFIYIEPKKLKDYAVYIKGTAAFTSIFRAVTRDYSNYQNKTTSQKIKKTIDKAFKKIENVKYAETSIEKYRKYFSGLMQTNESTITESFAGEYEKVEVPLTEEVLIEAANNAARHTKWCKMESFPFCSVHELQSCLVSVKDASFAFATFDGSEKDLNYIINSCNRNSTFRYGKYEVSCIPNSQGTKYLCGKITELYEYVKKSILTEETRLDNAPSNMYHLSTENHNGDVFEPRYYDNDNVKAGTERRVKRICFSDSINGCIYSIFPSGAYDVDLYVHIPGSEVTKVYETTQDDIYDSKITHELWVKEPVTMKCIGKIHISGVYKDKVKVLEADKDKTGYGKRKYYEPRWNWVEKINEAYIEEQTTSSVKVYHLSQSNLDGKTLSPRVPSNYFTKNGYEDGKTARVCFAKSIDMCLRALSQKCTDMELFVHVPDGKYNIYIPSTKEVPDAKITSEVWIKEPVKLKCIGKIKVIKDKGEDGIPYKYGDNTAELYDWEWKWIEKMNESSNLKEFSVGAGPVVGIGSNPEPIYIVNYMQNNVFSGATQERFGICKAGMKDLHTFGGKYNRLHYTNLEEFEKEASNIKVYRYTGPLSDKYPSIYSIIEDADTDLDFYRLLTGNEIDNRSSIKNDPYFQRESYINDELSAITECVVAGVKEIDNKYEIPMIGLNEDGRVYNYYRDLDGVYIKNEVTNMRSGSYDDINDIPEEVNNLVIKGVY